MPGDALLISYQLSVISYQLSLAQRLALFDFWSLMNKHYFLRSFPNNE
jgi:hypothetical protein